jgi:G:T-mismatch repair DNA endonuclease (very short patch repair protein)
LWRKKINGNHRRDPHVTRALRAAGWRVVRIWECALTKIPDTCVRRIQRLFLVHPS